MRPLLDDEKYEKVVQQSKEFESGIGKKLQRYLVLKSWWSSNYVSDWWEEYVYLRGRSSLMVNSNVYGTDCFKVPSTKQTARAGSIIHYLLQFRQKIEREEMKPIMVQGLVPLCSWQYERMFNTTRVPGIEVDKVVHFEDIKHIAVLHKGCYYKVMIYHNGRLLNPLEIQYQLDLILKSKEKSSHGEEYLASLTSWDRTKWAETRNKHFSTGINKISIEEIESSAFLLILEDETFEIGSDSSQIGKDYVINCLHGKIYNRWFDKSFSMSVATNGRVS
jgi:carnitine O-palmitoyltransferase 1